MCAILFFSLHLPKAKVKLGSCSAASGQRKPNLSKLQQPHTTQLAPIGVPGPRIFPTSSPRCLRPGKGAATPSTLQVLQKTKWGGVRSQVSSQNPSEVYH